MGGNGKSNGRPSTGITLIIPAYNEANNISKVLTPALAAKSVGRIVVVDDGSSDHTSSIAGSFPGVEVIKQHNRGKAGAMDTGIKATEESILLFLDADLEGLTTQHIEDLIAPVKEGRCEMTLGLFYGPPHPSRWAHRVSPGLSGQRAIRREVFDQLKDIGDMGYGIETALNKLVRRNRVRMVKVRMDGVSQSMKEEKHGFVVGAKFRARMFYEVVKTKFSRPYKPAK